MENEKIEKSEIALKEEKILEFWDKNKWKLINKFKQLNWMG